MMTNNKEIWQIRSTFNMTHHPKQYKQNKVHNVQNTSNSIIQDTVINLGRKKTEFKKTEQYIRINNIE